VGEPEPREAADDILPQETLPVGEEPEDDPEPIEDEELPEPLAKVEPEDPPEPSGSAFPQPTAISLNSK
jgi:hypothetical protein